MSVTAVVARGIAWFSSIRCDNDLANVSPRFKEIVGGSHRFGSKPCEQGRYNRSDSSFSDERSYCFESASLALNVVPVEHLAEDHLRMQRSSSVEPPRAAHLRIVSRLGHTTYLIHIWTKRSKVLGLMLSLVIEHKGGAWRVPCTRRFSSLLLSHFAQIPNSQRSRFRSRNCFVYITQCS